MQLPYIHTDNECDAFHRARIQNSFAQCLLCFIYEINGFCRMISKSESDDRRTLPIRQVLPDLRFP